MTVVLEHANIITHVIPEICPNVMHCDTRNTEHYLSGKFEKRKMNLCLDKYSIIIWELNLTYYIVDNRSNDIVTRP